MDNQHFDTLVNLCRELHIVLNLEPEETVYYNLYFVRARITHFPSCCFAKYRKFKVISISDWYSLISVINPVKSFVFLATKNASLKNYQ